MRTRRAPATERREHAGVGLEVALEGEYADPERSLAFQNAEGEESAAFSDFSFVGAGTRWRLDLDGQGLLARETTVVDAALRSGSRSGSQGRSS